MVNSLFFLFPSVFFFLPLLFFTLIIIFPYFFLLPSYLLLSLSWFHSFPFSIIFFYSSLKVFLHLLSFPSLLILSQIFIHPFFSSFYIHFHGNSSPVFQHIVYFLDIGQTSSSCNFQSFQSSAFWTQLTESPPPKPTSSESLCRFFQHPDSRHSISPPSLSSLDRVQPFQDLTANSFFYSKILLELFLSLLVR